MADYQRFLEKLTAKSEAGSLAWRPTVESEAFSASIEGEFTVKISRTARQEYAFELRDQRGNQLLSLSAEKTRAWEQGFEQAIELLDILQRLYEAARVVALDVRKQLSRAESLLDRS